MILPAAALAVFLLCFVVVYGSMLQARVDTRSTPLAREEPTGDTDRS